MENDKITKEGEVEKECQSSNGSRCRNNARRSDTVISQNKGMRNNHEGDPNDQVTLEQLHPKDEYHKVQGCKNGRRQTKIQWKKRLARHNKNHRRV